MTADLMHNPAMTLPVATSRPPAYVKAENATFRGPRGPIFADCTLTIRPGERWAILGPNGSGKGVLVAAFMASWGCWPDDCAIPFSKAIPASRIPCSACSRLEPWPWPP